MSAVGNRVDLQLQDQPSGNLALCHHTVLQEEVQMRTTQAFKSQELWPAVTTLLLGCQVRPRMCAVVVVVGGRFVCLCVCVCVALRGRGIVQTFNMVSSPRNKSIQSLRRTVSSSLRKMASAVGIRSYKLE